MKIVIADNNSVRFVKRQYNQQPAGSAFTEVEAPYNRNYFNTLLYDEIRWNLQQNIQLYAQRYGDLSNYILQQFRGQALKIQLKSDTALTLDGNIKVNVTDASGANQIFTASLAKKIDNKNYRTRYTQVGFLDYGGYCAFYFGSTATYQFGTTTVIESGVTYYNGDIPPYLAVGQTIQLLYLGIGNPNNIEVADGEIITAITFDATLNKYVVVTSKAYTSVSNTTAQYISVHERSAYDIYELALTDFTGSGCRKIEITTSTDSFASITEKWESEFLYFDIDINEGQLLFQWWNDRDKFGIDFRTGLQNYCYLFCDMYELRPELNAVIASNETGGGKLLDSTYKRKFGLTFTGMPRHLAEKIALIFAHENVYINGKGFAMVEGSYESSPIEQTMLFEVKIEVTETELLGIYSDGYRNTTPTPEDIRDGDLLLIDDEGNTLDIGGGYGLNIDADELP